MRNIQLIFATLGLFLFIPSALADLPGNVRVKSTDSACVASAEICGDGIDQNCDGSDMACSGSDQDKDGYAAWQDCNDRDRYMYPGVQKVCWVNGQRGTQQCQSSGSYSACSTSPLCEATGSGKCYYISALGGSDTNPGTFQSPWKSYKNIVSNYEGSDSQQVRLSAGDVVYFFSGTYSFSYTYYSQGRAFHLRNVHGNSSSPIRIRSYPGENVVFDAAASVPSMYILQSSHIRIEGVEISGGYGAGIMLASVDNVEIVNSHIRDNDGPDNDNIAGVYVVDSSNIRVHHSLIHDNYDRLNHDTGGNKTENSRNIVLFRGGNIRIDHNVIFQTPSISASKTGGCITYKHSANIEGTIFEVDHNILANCFFTSIGSGSFGTRIHHNLIFDSDPIKVKDFGGTTHNRDVIVENNTIVNGQAFYYNPTDTWGPIGSVTFRDNVVVDNNAQNNETSTVTVHPYGSDALYSSVVTNRKLFLSNNCYHNSAGHQLRWSLFAAGGGYGSLGGLYSFEQWKMLGFDTGSAVTNPGLNAYYQPTTSSCTDAGHMAP